MTEKLIEKAHIFLNSRFSSFVYTVLACLTVSLSIEQYVIPLLILWLLFTLVMEKNFLNIFLPMILLNGFAIRTSGQATILLKHLWLVIPVIAAIVLHFVIHHKKPVLGKLFFAQVGISIALLLGGLFSISAEEYFSPDALYFVLLLGVGMLFFYIWFRNSVFSNEYYDCREKLMESLYAFGVFCAYSILDQAVRSLLTYGELVTPYVWANDICVMMIFAIPAAFYYARNRYLHLLVGFAFCGVMALTPSRAGLLTGGAILLLSLLYLAWVRKRRRWLTVSLFVLVLFAGVGVLVWFSARAGGFSFLFAGEENGRLALIKEAWQNFLSSPVFGVGIGAKGATETTFMTINWTHNFVMQVVGSMGVVGILAYGYQLYVRVRLFFARINAFTVAAFLSYLGLFLVSMMQPGEFCPMPYATMAVMIFAVLEISDEEAKNKEKAEKTTDAS